MQVRFFDYHIEPAGKILEDGTLLVPCIGTVELPALPEVGTSFWWEHCDVNWGWIVRHVTLVIDPDGSDPRGEVTCTYERIWTKKGSVRARHLYLDDQ